MLLGIQNLNLPNSSLIRVSISGRSNWLTRKLDCCNPVQTVVLPDTGEPEQATFIKAASLPSWQSHHSYFITIKCPRQQKTQLAKVIKMSLQTAPDIPLIITVPGPSTSAPPLLSAERRISPSWSISQLKAKLEPVTGIPPSVQQLRTRGFDGNWVAMEGEEKLVSDREWSAGVRRGGEIEVSVLHL